MIAPAPALLDTPGAVHDRFGALTGLLRDHDPLWRDRPFIMLRLDWEADHPDVGAYLRGLSHDQIDALEASAGLGFDDSAPTVLREWGRTCASHVQLGRFPATPLGEPGPRYRQSVPLRKWQQVWAFIAAARPLLPTGVRHVAEWCAGKGYLARTLSLVASLETVALERRADLCETGARAAEQLGAQRCRFVEVDVLSEDASGYLDPGGAAFGLHACGILTDALLEAATARQVRAVVAAPCCYHSLGGEVRYQPRSTVAADAGLELSQGNLRLATAHEQVARQPIRAARRRELAYRLGFDLLVREASGEDVYNPQGPFGRRLLDLPFAEFCVAAADKLQLSLPANFNVTRAEAAGAERARQVRGLSVLRGLWRRPLELWLVLDRALGLLEHGRPAVVGELCDPAITPRNLLIASVL